MFRITRIMSIFYLLNRQLHAQVFMLHATHTTHQSHDEKTDDLRTTQYLSAIKRCITCSMKFFFFWGCAVLYKATTPTCMKYGCYAWVGALCYGNGYVGLSVLAVSLEPLNRRQSLPMHYFFGRCLSEMAEFSPFLYSRGRPTRYYNSLHGFSVTIHRYYRDVTTTVSFLAELDHGISYMWITFFWLVICMA